MRAVGWVRVRLTGVVSGRRLNEMAACMRLRRVTHGEGGMEMDVRAADIQALRHILRGTGVRMHVVKRYGVARLRKKVRRHAALLIAAVCGLLAMLYVSQMALEVCVDGAKDARQEAEMLQVLEELGIKKGVYMGGVDKIGAAEEILRRFSGLTYAAVRRRGTMLELYVVQATQAPEIYDANLHTDVVAAAGGLVTRVVTLSGEAQVRPGDTVVPGQVLIAGTERAPHARGAVTARVWAVGTGTAEMIAVREERTGRKTETTGVCIGEKVWFMQESGYAKEAVEEERIQLLDGLFYPVEFVHSVHSETKCEETQRTISEVKDESGARAMTNALLALKNGACVVDKRVEYSMIEDGKLRAVATLESVMQIGEEKTRQDAAQE